MATLGEAIAAVGGGAPLKESAAARRRTDRATRRRVGKLVDRGEAAETVEDAELAVLFARDRRRSESHTGPVVWALLLALPIAALGFGVSDLTRDRVASGMLFLAFGVWMIAFAAKTFTRRGRAERAERLNVEKLGSAGQPVPVTSGEVVAPPVTLLAFGAALLLVYYVAFFGTFRRVIDGDPVTLAGVIDAGWPFGVLMTGFNLVWGRTRNRRAARDGASPTEEPA